MNRQRKTGLLAHGRHRSAALLVAVKVAIVALVLVLPSGLALSLGAAHVVAIALVAVAAAVLLVVRHGSRERAGRTHQSGRRMLTAETAIATTNATRYLVQLCSHATKMGRLHGRGTHERPEVLDVDWSDRHGVLTLSWGRCTLDADSTTLTVRVEAADDEHLELVQDLVTTDLERFGKRERLVVAWQS